MKYVQEDLNVRKFMYIYLFRYMFMVTHYEYNETIC